MTVDELHAEIIKTEERSRSNTHRIDQLEERQDSFDQLVRSVAVMATKQESMERDLGEIKRDVKTISDRPGKRWDAVVDKILLCIIGAIMAYILAKVGF